MYWLYGAYFSSIMLVLLLEITKRIRVNKNGIVEKRYYNPLLVFMYVCPLIYVAACRNSFWDTGDYRLMYEAIGKSFENVFNNTVMHVEKGYLCFTVLLNRINDDSQFLIIVSSIFVLSITCYFLYKESTQLPISFLIYSSQMWMSTMNGLRQCMVAAVLWLAWRRWSNSRQCLKNDILFFIAIVLMSSFHKSVLICIPIFFCARGKLWNKKTMFCIVTSFVMLLIPPIYNLLFGILLGGTEYAGYINTTASMGISRFIISCFPITLIWLYHHNYIKDRERDRLNKMIWMMNLSCINFACNILALKMVYFARIGMYLSIFDLITIPYCIEKCFKSDSRKIMKVLLLIFYIYFFYRQLIAYGSFASNFKLFYEVR